MGVFVNDFNRFAIGPDGDRDHLCASTDHHGLDAGQDLRQAADMRGISRPETSKTTRNPCMQGVQNLYRCCTYSLYLCPRI